MLYKYFCPVDTLSICSHMEKNSIEPKYERCDKYKKKTWQRHENHVGSLSHFDPRLTKSIWVQQGGFCWQAKLYFKPDMLHNTGH